MQLGERLVERELVTLVNEWGVDDAGAAGIVARAMAVLMAGDRQTAAEAFVRLRWRGIQERRSLVDVASLVTTTA